MARAIMALAAVAVFAFAAETQPADASCRVIPGAPYQAGDEDAIGHKLTMRCRTRADRRISLEGVAILSSGRQVTLRRFTFRDRTRTPGGTMVRACSQFKDAGDAGDRPQSIFTRGTARYARGGRLIATRDSAVVAFASLCPELVEEWQQNDS